MANAIVDWGGVKPSITYGPKGNRSRVSIGSWDGWVRKELTYSADEGEDDKEEKKDDEALVRAFHSEGYDKYNHCKVNCGSPIWRLNTEIWKYGSVFPYLPWFILSPWYIRVN